MAEIIKSSQIVSGKIVYLIVWLVSKVRSHQLQRKISKGWEGDKESSWRGKGTSY